MDFSHIVGDGSEQLLKRLTFLELTDSDMQLLKAEAPQLANITATVKQAFLAHLAQEPELKYILTTPRLQAISSKLDDYFLTMVSGCYDSRYVQHRQEVGIIHQLLGVDVKWYLGAYSKYASVLLEQVCRLYQGNHEYALRIVNALIRVLFFDIGLALDAYMAAEEQEIFRSREISVRAIEILQNTVVGDDVDYLTNLMAQISHSLTVRYAMVVRIEGPDYEDARVLAAVDQGEAMVNVNYQLSGTPCNNVFQTGACVYPENIQGLFPEDTMLKTMQAESYAGIPIRDRWGHTIGLLIVLDDKPFADPGMIEQILLMVGGRVAAEVIRAEMGQELAATMGKLEFHATRDDLTGLPNRVLFRDRLNQAVYEAHRNETAVALFHVDLDDFKLVNDTLGHAAGDALLIGTAKRLKSCVRQGDTIARVGGDEFMIILRDITELGCTNMVAEKIHRVMREPFLLTEDEHYQNVSIGISISPQDTDDVEVLVRYADIAVHRAKEIGRGGYQFFSQDMSERTLQRVHMEKMLRTAIEQEEFVIYYQPITDLNTRKLIGAEALIRWIHPVQGLIPPDRFIPLSESTKLIIPLGHWIINQVCKDLAFVDSLGGKRLSFAINISPAQINDVELLEVLRLALQDNKLDPHQVILEITENMFLHDAEYTFQLLQQFKKLGLRLSLDDFGTGYSSLSYLKKYPFDKVKIDQSFVSDLPDDTDDAAIAIATISMAHALGLTVVAEGVETEDQADYLQANKCDFVQGYYFARPMPLAEFIEKYRDDLEPHG